MKIVFKELFLINFIFRFYLFFSRLFGDLKQFIFVRTEETESLTTSTHSRRSPDFFLLIFNQISDIKKRKTS